MKKWRESYDEDGNWNPKKLIRTAEISKNTALFKMGLIEDLNDCHVDQLVDFYVELNKAYKNRKKDELIDGLNEFHNEAKVFIQDDANRREVEDFKSKVRQEIEEMGNLENVSTVKLLEFCFILGIQGINSFTRKNTLIKKINSLING